MRLAKATTFERKSAVTVRNLALLSLLLLVASSWGAPASAVVVDDFSTADAEISLADPADSAGDTTQSFVMGGGMVGGERLLTLSMISTAANSGTSAEVVGGQLVFAADAGVRGQIRVSWDATTGDPTGPLDTTVGLGGVDLTAGNHSGLRLSVDSTTVAGAEVELDVHSSSTNASRFVLKLPLVASSTGFVCSFSDFVQLGSGGAADFTAVTAIVLKVRGTGVGATFNSLETLGPELLQANVLNVDTLDDSDMDGFADPGETITYTVTLTNTGAEAQTVNLGDVLDANVDGQTMTLFTTPIAQRDTYQTCGNASLNIPAGSGVLANDSDPDGDSTLPDVADPILTVTATDTSNTAGTVMINADGSFTYNPPALFLGVDTFGYTVTDDDGRTSTGEVAVVMEGVLWFVDDDDDTGPFEGTQANPFNALPQVEAASNPGDIIYIVSDDGNIDRLDDTLTLKDDQQLIGGGVALTACGLNIAAGTAPGISDAALGGGGGMAPDLFGKRNRRDLTADKGMLPGGTLNVANRNVVRGIRLEGSGPTVLSAESVQNLTVEDVTLDRQADTEGPFLTNVSGTVTFTRLTAQETGVEGAVLNLDSSNATINVVDSTLTPTGGALFFAFDDDSDVTFTGGTMSLTGGNNFAAIDIDSGSGTYSFGSLTSIATSQQGILAVDGGTFTVPATATINSSGGCLELDNTSFGVDPLVLASLTCTGGNRGVLMSNVTEGLTVTGAVQISGVDNGIAVGGSGTVTMTNATNSVASTNGPALDLNLNNANLTFATLSSSDSGGNSVRLNGATGTIVANGGALTNTSAQAVVSVDGGSGTFTYAGTVTANGTGRSLEVQNRNAGTVNVSGAIDDNGGGVRLAGNTGGTINISGGMDIDSGTSIGFEAVGGGTINVTADMVTNTVDVAMAPSAVLLNGITIGANDMTFTSINSASTTGAGVSIDSTSNAGTFNGGNVIVNGTGGGAPGITITDSSATFNFTSATIDNTGGRGIVLADENGPVTFTTVDIDGTGAAGIDIDGNTNTVLVDGGSIGATTSSGGDGVIIDSSSGNVTIDATIRQTTGNNSVFVTNKTGGTALFNGAITDTADGILLSGIGAGTVTFRGGMTLDTGNSTAFTATGGGTVNVCPTALCSGGGSAVNNDIGSNTALSMQAINMDTVAIGSENVTFRRVSVDGGGSGATAIRLRNTSGAGIFRVSGDGTTSAGGNGSGGTIENINENDAIILDNTGTLVSLQNMIIEDIAGNADASEAIGTRSFHDGIHGQNVNAGLRLQSMTLRRFSDHAILGASFADGVSFTSWNGLEIRDSVFQNSNRFHVANRGDDGDEGMIRVRGLTGTMVMTNSAVSLGARGLDIFTPAGAGTLDATIQSSTFTDIYKEFNSGATVNVGGRGVSFQARGSHDMVVRIGDPAELNDALGNTFTNNLTASIVILGQEGGSDPHTGDIDTIISRNDFIITDHSTPQQAPGNFQFNFPQGGVSLNPAGGTYDAIVSHNLFDEVMRAAGGLGQLTLGLNGGAVQAHVNNNTFRLPWDFSVQVRAEGTSSAAVLFENNTYEDGMVGSATDDLGGPSPSPFGPFLVNVLDGGSLDLTLRNEVLPQHDVVFTPGDRRQSFIAEVQADNASNNLDLHLLDNRGPEGYALRQFNGSFDLFRGASASSVAATIVDDNGNTGGPVMGVGNDNTDPPTVLTMGTITATNTAPTLPVIVIP